MNPVLRTRKWATMVLASLHMSTVMPMLQDVGFVISLGWILYRVWQIYHISVEELVELLGLDIPAVPEVSLAGITTESFLLYWKPPEDRHPPMKYAIQVNGIKVGDFGLGDASIQVIGLQPAHFYSVRAIATNTANFSTLGPLIRLRTTPLSSPSSGEVSIFDRRDVEYLPFDNESATITTAPPPPDTLSSSTIYRIARESNRSRCYARRTLSGRRATLTTQSAECSTNIDFQGSREMNSGSGECIRDLTERLNLARSDQQEIDKQVQEEEQESKRTVIELARERDRLKHILKEKEDNNLDLKKQSNHLDKLSRAAQSKKASKEKVLLQKRAERQRIEDETAQWNQEISKMNRETDEMIADEAVVIRGKESDVNEIRTRISRDQVLVKSMEEEIRVKGIQIKAIEENRENPDSHNHARRENTGTEKGSEHTWEMTACGTQAQLLKLQQMLQQAQAENQRAQENLAWWTFKHARDSSQFAPIPALEFIPSIKSNRSRRLRQANSRSSTVSMPSGAYPASSLSFNNGSAISPTFSLASPFFNMSNGMAVPPSLEQTNIYQRDEHTADGGAMSPAANNLLPSNLFRDDDIINSRVSNTVRGCESLNNTASERTSAQGIFTAEAIAGGPHTPGSTGSRAGSRFSSPHESLHNLHGYQSHAGSFIDSDRHSLGSTGGSYHPSMTAETSPLTANRITSLFATTFNRQRGKSSTHEPPSLGTLKQGQSQSFPRKMEAGPLDAVGSRRRRGSYGNWANPVAGLLNRNISGSHTSPESNGLTTAHTGSGRRSRLNMFGSRFDEMEQSDMAKNAPSLRPSSTYPYDAMPGRFGNDNQRLAWLASEGCVSRSSPLGAGWSTSVGPWSRGPSRRASVQLGSTSNLSIGSTPLESDDYQGASTKPFPEQLPIGTRPHSAQRSFTPKLNPTAPTFKTIFTRGDAKRAAKAEKAIDKSQEKTKIKSNERAGVDETDGQCEEDSTLNPRLSKDAHSVTTATSMADSYDSLDRSISGTPETVTTLGTKETLMQKITRKSSSSKFNVQWAKERSGLFNKRGGEPLTPDDISEDTSSERQLAKSVDSVGGMLQYEKANRSSLSWPNIRRKTKKTGQTNFDMGELTNDAGDEVDV